LALPIYNNIFNVKDDADFLICTRLKNELISKVLSWICISIGNHDATLG